MSKEMNINGDQLFMGLSGERKKLTLLHSTCQSEKSLNQLYYESSERLLK